MSTIFISLAIGFFIGYKKFLSDKMIRLNSKLQTVWLLLLIFSMGVSIGADKEVISQLPTLGWKAFLFAVFAVVMSILVVYLFSFWIDKGDKKS